MNNTKVRVDFEKLTRFVTNLFIAMGMRPEDAEIQARVHTETELMGNESHGLPLLEWYNERVKMKSINLLPNIRVIKESPTMAMVDGDNGLGQLISYRAMQICMKKAKSAGMAVVTAKHSNHFGPAGYYVRMAYENDLIGFASTNGGKVLVPTFGCEPMVGNNPLAIGIPADKEPSFMLDMACSTVAMGKVIKMLRMEADVPAGWGFNEDISGWELNAQTLRDSRLLTPLGGERETSGHKGYSLAVAMEAFCGVLSDANFGPRHVEISLRQQKPWAIGHFFMCIDPSLFMEIGEFKSRMDELLAYFKAGKKAPGHDRIFTAGEPEYDTEQEQLKNGIAIHPKVNDVLAKLADEYDLPLDIAKE